MRIESKGIWIALAIAALSTAAVFSASLTTAYSDFDHWTYDTVVDVAGKAHPTDRIVMVDFDEDTFSHIQKFPIPRSTIAEVIKKVGGKAKIIGLDIFLSEPRTPEEDQAMQDALTGAGNVVVAAQAPIGILPGVKPLPIFCQPEDVKAASGYCKENTPGALGYAFVNMVIDADGFVRRGILIQDQAISFPVMLASLATGETLKAKNRHNASFLGHTVPYEDPDLKTILIGLWSEHPAKNISAWQVLTDKVPAGTFDDRIVLIGESNDAAHDRDFTPIFRVEQPDGTRVRMAGTQIHAAAIRSLLEAKVARKTPRTAVWVVVFLLALGTSWMVLEDKLYFAVFGILGCMIAVCGASLGLFAGLRLWLPFLPAQIAMSMTLPLGLAVQYLHEKVLHSEAQALRQQLMAIFSKYVDPEVAHRIWLRRDEVSLAGEERTATVMFSDIRSFTALSANKPPEVVLGWLNEYMTEMDSVIREYGGFLNKFIGDGIMIIFGVPLSQGRKEDARRAISASLAMLDRVTQMNARHEGNPNFPCLRIGIGIHTGSLMAGSIGSANRQEYSVIGETVNLASRLESLNKQFKTEILMSTSTYDAVKDCFEGFEGLGKAKVAGFEEPVDVFTIRPQPKELEVKSEIVFSEVDA